MNDEPLETEFTEFDDPRQLILDEAGVDETGGLAPAQPPDEGAEEPMQMSCCRRKRTMSGGNYRQSSY